MMVNIRVWQLPQKQTRYFSDFMHQLFSGINMSICVLLLGIFHYELPATYWISTLAIHEICLKIWVGVAQNRIRLYCFCDSLKDSYWLMMPDIDEINFEKIMSSLLFLYCCNVFSTYTILFGTLIHGSFKSFKECKKVVCKFEHILVSKIFKFDNCALHSVFYWYLLILYNFK